MRFLIGTDAQILAVNQQEAKDRRCKGVTTEWYATRQTNLGMTCLMIDDDKDLPGSVTDEPEWGVLE